MCVCESGDDDTRSYHTNALPDYTHSCINLDFFCTLKNPIYRVNISLSVMMCIVDRIESRLPNLKHHDKNLNAELKLESKQQQ